MKAEERPIMDKNSISGDDEIANFSGLSSSRRSISASSSSASKSQQMDVQRSSTPTFNKLKHQPLYPYYRHKYFMTGSALSEVSLNELLEKSGSLTTHPSHTQVHCSSPLLRPRSAGLEMSVSVVGNIPLICSIVIRYSG
jgi:hypothetical protein